MPGQAPPFVPDDSLAQLLLGFARLDERLADVLRRLDRLETQLAGGDQDVLRRLTAIEAAQREAERKRDEAREVSARAHQDVIARLEAVEQRQESAAAQARWRWSAWQVLVGFAAVAGGILAAAFAIADHT